MHSPPPPDNSVDPTVRVFAAFALALFGVGLIAIAWSVFSAEHVIAVLSNCAEVRGKYEEIGRILCMVSNAFISSLPESILQIVEGTAVLLGGVFLIYLAWVIWPKLDDTPSTSN